MRTEKALNLRAILSRPLDRPHIRQCVLCAELIKHMRELREGARRLAEQADVAAVVLPDHREDVRVRRTRVRPAAEAHVGGRVGERRPGLSGEIKAVDSVADACEKLVSLFE